MSEQLFWQPGESILKSLKAWCVKEVKDAVNDFAGSVECTGRLDDSTGEFYVDADAWGPWDGDVDCPKSRKTICDILDDVWELHCGLNKEITGVEAVVVMEAIKKIEVKIAEIQGFLKP